jgi:hypothetical protein
MSLWQCRNSGSYAREVTHLDEAWGRFFDPGLSSHTTSSSETLRGQLHNSLPAPPVAHHFRCAKSEAVRLGSNECLNIVLSQGKVADEVAEAWISPDKRR